MKTRILALLLALALFLTGCTAEDSSVSAATVPPSSAPTPVPESTAAAPAKELIPEKAVTVMVYMTGSDLEPSAAAASADLEEMAQSGIDLSLVNLLVYTGGAKKWFSDISVEENVLLQLTPEGFQPVDHDPLLSMGDPENLSRFLNTAWEKYPAACFHLICWNHGNGPVIGYGKDTLFDNDSLTLPELQTALKASPFGPDRRLGIIGFDACLMASAELACVTGDYADYLVSSQETEPFFGWDYAFLGSCGSVPTEELARTISDDYLAYCNAYYDAHRFFRSDVTMSVVDLSCAKELERAIDALFSRAADLVGEDYNRFAAARIRTRALGRASTSSEYDLVDLESLIGQMEELCPDEAASLREILAQAVLSSETNTEGCCGLSLYYPCFNPDYYRNTWKEDYWALGLFPHYLRYLEQYEQVWLSPEQQPSFQGKLVPEAGFEPQVYQLQLTEEQQAAYAYSYFMILRKESEGLYKQIFVSPDVSERDGLLQAHFDGRIIYMENDFGDRFLPAVYIRDVVGSKMQMETYGQLGLTNAFISEGDSVRIQLSADTAAEEVTIQGIYPIGDDAPPLGEGKQVPSDLNQWHFFGSWIPMSRYLIRDENGRIPSYWDWPEHAVYVWQSFSLGDGLCFRYEPLYQDGHEYYLIFDIGDVYGNRYSSEPLPITTDIAPASEQQSDEELIHWEGGFRQLICEQDGVRVSMISYRAMDADRALLAILFENSTDDKIGYTVKDFDFNHRIRMDYWASSLDPREKVLRVIDDAAEICTLLGLDRPDTVSFTLELKDNSSGKTLLRDRRFTVFTAEAPEPDYLLLPWSGAIAENQTLAQENDVSVTLLGLGYYLNEHPEGADRQPDSLELLLQLDSSSLSRSVFSVDALIINGERLTRSGGGLLYDPGQIVAEPGELRFALLRFTPAEVPDRISSLALELNLDGIISTVPITLGTGRSALAADGAPAPES